MPPFHIALAILITLIWAFNFVVVKVGLDSFPPLFFLVLRYIVASLPFMLFVPAPKIGWRSILAIGTFMSTLEFGLLFVGINLGMPIGLTSAVMQLQVMLTMIFAIPILHERPRAQNIAAFVLGFAGVLVIAGHLGDVPVLPFILVLGAAASWAMSNVLTRKAAPSDGFGLVIWSSSTSIPPLFVVSLLMEGPHAMASSIVGITWIGIGAIAFTSLASTIVGYGLWSFLLKHHRAAMVAPFTMLVPLWTIALSYWVFAEQLSTPKLIGSGLIVAGVAANSWPSRAKAAPRIQPNQAA